MDLPISIDVHPSSPPSRLQSPEPSGTPDLRRLSAHRDTATFSYEHGLPSRNSPEASVDFSDRQLDYIETSPFLSSNGIAAQKSMQGVDCSMCSLSDEENSQVNERSISQAGSHLGRANSKPKNAQKMSESSHAITWKVQPTTISSIECLEGYPQGLKNELRSCSQEFRLVGGMHSKLLDLSQKVGVSHWNPDLKTSSSVSIPLKNRSTLGILSELQKKVGVLKSQLVEERSQRQAVGQKLNNLRSEHEKELLKKQKLWESKFRELQKEKYTLSVQLQKLEMESPRQRLAHGGEVHFTEDDVKHLRQEIEEQESLLRGYQIVSEKKMLEDKIMELQKVLGNQRSQSWKSSDAACQCVMLPDYGSEGLMPDICELSVGTEDFLCNLANIKDKENCLTSTDTLHNNRDDTEQTKLQRLQKKLDKMKRDYDLKIRDLKQQIQKMSTPPQDKEKSNARRVKELEVQISDIRSFYTKKLKELSEKADTKRTKKSQRKVSGTWKKETPPEISTVEALRMSEEKVASLEESLKEKIAVIRHLEDNLLRGLSNCFADKPSRKSCRKSCEVADVSHTSPKMVASQKGMPSRSMQEEFCALHVEEPQPGVIEDEISLKVCKPALLAECKGGTEVGLQLNILQDHKKGSSLNPVAGSSEYQAEISKIQYSSIENENQTLNSRSENASERSYPCNVSTDSMMLCEQLQILQRKVREMEARQAQRELEWQAALADMKRLLNLEHDVAERKWQLAVEAKNAEIECFRSEVETLLETAMQIQKVQLSTS